MVSPKPIFDAVRRMMGRGFTQAEVRELDAAIAEAAHVKPDALSEPEEPGIPVVWATTG